MPLIRFVTDVDFADVRGDEPSDDAIDWAIRPAPMLSQPFTGISIHFRSAPGAPWT